MRYCIDAGTRISELTSDQSAKLFDRGRATDESVVARVSKIIQDVRQRGDQALKEQAQQFDNVENLVIEVPREEWSKALEQLDAPVREALEYAARNIAAFHEAQLPQLLEVEVQPGIKLGRRADAIERVAVYAPGGRAAYPSSVLMGVVPARVAGVKEIVVCSPAGPDGKPPATVMAACAIGGANRLFAIGGAGAIAAVAYGTGTVPKVDKIVGPGNAYVTEAKRQVNGIAAIDCPAGPSEVLVLADESADPRFIAYELLAQAEHDPDAASVLVSTNADVIKTVDEVLDAELPRQPRREIIEASLKARGALLLASSKAEMLAFSSRYAPEHLALYVNDAKDALGRVRNAGTVFVGQNSSVAFGDYLTGANHVLPTAGLARAYSGLSTLDFVRWTTYQTVTTEAAAQIAETTHILAEAEGLPAHATAARLRA